MTGRCDCIALFRTLSNELLVSSWSLPRRSVILLLGLILVSKAAAVLVRGPVPIELDAHQYWQLSTSVIQGDVLLASHPIGFRTPAYPWFLGGVRLFFDRYSLAAVVAMQGVLSVASLVMAGVLAKRITRIPAALPWTMLVCVPSVSALTFAATTLSESLFVFLLMANLLAVQRHSDEPNVAASAWTGVTFALTLLTRPIVLLLWVPHLIFLLCPALSLRRDRPGWKLLWVAPVVAMTLITPWLARNDAMFGKPFVTEFVGRNLWIVTFQEGVGGKFAMADTPASETLARRLDAVGITEDRDKTWMVSGGLVRSGLSDAQADQLMKQVAIDAIKTNPMQFVKYAAIRSLNFWRTRATSIPQPIEGNFKNQFRWQVSVPPVDWWLDHRASNQLWINNLLLASTALSIVVITANGPSRWAGVWLAMVMIYFSVITGVFEIPAYRYRMVVEPVVACVHGAAITITLSRRRLNANGVLQT